jgi:hypothetical protein
VVGGACSRKLPAFAADARYTSRTVYRIDDEVKQTTDHRPLHSTIAIIVSWLDPALSPSLPLSLYPLLSLLPAPAALCVTADLRCLAVPATPETRFDRS